MPAVPAKGGGAGGGLVTLDVAGGISTGLQENRYWTEILKEDLGIVLNLVPHDTDAINTMMAARNITADVVIWNDAQLENAIRAGLLLNLDDRRDKLPNVFANAGTSIQYVRDNISNGTGGLYGLRGNVGTMLPSSRFLEGPYLRWDFYKELGYPELTNLEDYLPLMRKMLDAHPTNDNGQRMYGFALFSDWDGTFMQNAWWIGPTHEGKWSPGGFLEIDLGDLSVGTILDDNSSYKKALQLLYDANQMGLVDPNSPSMGFSQELELLEAARVLFWPGYIANSGRLTTEQEAAGMGYRMIPFANERIGGGTIQYVGSDIISISKNSKNVDKALEYVDYLYSPDGVWNLVNGRRGVKWDLDQNGEPYLTDLGWDIQYNNKEFPNGGLNGEGRYYVNFAGLGDMIHPVYKRNFNPDADWADKRGTLVTDQDSPLDRDWKTKMNAAGDGDYFRKNNRVLEVPFAPMNPAPENIQMINSRIGDTVTTMSWQMVFARNQAEFDSLWADMVQRANGMGVAASNEWYLTEWNRARAAASKYIPK
ncbi:MAG: extracellular solute-binding protein [Treponema sp.]|nr:extracellular solute-binding protein [Treponema sp.]